MKKKLLVLLFSLATLGLVSCGGNDAASGTSAVSAAAPTSTTTTTEAKLNGQVDERTGVAPVVAQFTVAETIEACTASGTYGGTGPLLTSTTVPTLAQCAAVLQGIATGNPWTVNLSGGCGNSTNLGGSGETLTDTQFKACSNALIAATTVNQCIALGGTCGQPYYGCWGGWLAYPGANCYAGTTAN